MTTTQQEISDEHTSEHNNDKYTIEHNNDKHTSEHNNDKHTIVSKHTSEHNNDTHIMKHTSEHIELVRSFNITSKNIDAENTCFFGTAYGYTAICIVPSTTITQNNLHDILCNDLELVLQNDVYYKFMSLYMPGITFRFICPASDTHVMKYKSKYKYTLETYDQYTQLRKDKVLWIKNILNGNATDKVLYEDNDFIIIENYKWNNKDISDLYLLLIYKDIRLTTIRDITDVSLLYKAQSVVSNIVKEYGLQYNDVVNFFHYRPTYYQLHLHIVNANHQNSSMSIVRAKLLEDVIRNIETDIDYYKKSMWISIKD